MESIRRFILEQVSAKLLSKSQAKKMLMELADSPNKLSEDIAIIGMSGKFPKARDLEDFWSNIAGGVSCIDIPSVSRRAVIETVYEKFYGLKDIQEESYEPGGYLDEIDKFDADFFGISSKEAVFIEPLQRIMLEEVYLALEDAGIGKTGATGSNTGVYIGRDHACESTYARTIGNIHPLVLTGSYAAVLSSRISHVFNFTGPSLVFDSACSSGLVAIHYACQAIKNGECDTAVAGGINIKENLLLDVNNPMAKILTSEAVVRTFDKNAKGTLLGEGVGVVVLKAMSRALADGDTIHAVIKGSAINNDGMTNGISTPRAQTQAECLIKAWKDAGIPPDSLSYIEVHGTGTLLGDPIEIKAITSAFEQFTDKKQFCAVRTAKTNIGHTVAASGMASLLNAVLALKHKKIPGMLNFQEPNPYINFVDSPVFVNDTTTDWPEERHPRRCGVNSFGFSGTNCHIVLEEKPPVPDVWREAAGAHIFTVSAQKQLLLEELVKKYIHYFRQDHLPDLEDICYTSSVGRGHYEHRIAIVANDISSLKEALNNIVVNGLSDRQDEAVYYGFHKLIKFDKEDRQEHERTAEDILQDSGQVNMLLASASSQEQLSTICKAYVAGAAVNWQTLYRQRKVSKVSLPVYPLERKACWFDYNQMEEYERKNNRRKERLEKKKNPRTPKTRTKEPVRITGRDSNEYTKMERTVAQAWGAVFEVKEVSIAEDFYEYGDSVRGMQIINLVMNEENMNADITDLLMNPTIEKLAKCLEAKREAGALPVKRFAPVVQAEPRAVYPLSSAQRRLFIIHQIEPGVAYNLPRVLFLEGKVDHQRLQDIFQTLVDRHESFRTSFELVHGEPVQRIHSNLPFSLEYSEGEEAGTKEKIAAFVQTFDLSKPPLLRGKLIKLAAQKFMLMLDMHHIIADRMSISIIMQEFIQLYEEKNLPALPVQYKDFALWQNQFLLSDDIKEQEKYWLDVFSDLPDMQLPYDYPKEYAGSLEEDMININLDPELTAQIRTFLSANEVTLNMMLLAVYNVLLWKWTGQEDIVVGLSLLGRQQVEVEGVVGMFINTVAVRNHPSSNKSFSIFLQEVKMSLLQAYANQDYPFEQLIDKLGKRTEYQRNPLFNTMFIMQNINLPFVQMNGLKMEPAEFEVTDSRFDIQLDAFEGDGAVRLSLLYCKGLFHRETMERLVRRYAELIAQIMEQPGRGLGELERETGEKQVMLSGFNDDFE